MRKKLVIEPNRWLARRMTYEEADELLQRVLPRKHPYFDDWMRNVTVVMHQLNEAWARAARDWMKTHEARPRKKKPIQYWAPSKDVRFQRKK